MYAYACLYQSDTDRVMEVDPEEITLTFVCMRYPRKLLGHLKKGRELQDLMERYERHRHSKWYQAAMDLIVRANWDRMKEEKEMCEALRELFADELQESKEQGEETKLISWICAKLKKDKPISAIIEDFGELGEPEEKVSLICETARRFAPDYDVDEIYAALAERGRRGAGEKQVNEPSGCVSGK